MLLLAVPTLVQAQFSYVTNGGAITITGYTGPGGAVPIPGTIDGLPVTGIGDYAFAFRTSLTEVTIPGSVTSIGAWAFRYCSSLTSVTIGNGVTSIGDEAFNSCTSLTSVTIGNGVASIGDGAFESCDSLTSVTIPNSVASIGDYAFFFGTGLRAVYFQGDAPTFGQDVFSGGNQATVYYLPGTTGWGSTFGGAPTALWTLRYPLILNNGSGFGVGTNGFGFLILWPTNISVVVEATASLANPVWAPVATNTLAGGVSDFIDPQWTNYPARFYRVTAP